MPRWSVEIALVRWIASLGGQSWFVDHLAAQMVVSLFFRSVPCVTILAGYWAAAEISRERLRAVRARVLGGFLAAGGALTVSRLVQNLWQDPRPINDPALGGLFQAPFRTVGPHDLHAFPSDHAAFLVPLVWTVWQLQPWLGAGTAVLLACALLARAYVGLHFPTDILAGAILGAVIAWGERRWPEVARRGVALVDEARALWPVATAAGLFLIAYCYASMFESVRDLAQAVVRALGYL
jgi:membrane-associated phospholipid phosphatase